MVVVEGINGLELVHEYGHMKGLTHRLDSAAIMHQSESAGANEVNVNESFALTD